MCKPELRKWKINVINNARFSWSIENRCQEEMDYQRSDTLMDDVTFIRSQSDCSVWKAAHHLMKPPQISASTGNKLGPQKYRRWTAVVFKTSQPLRVMIHIL